MIRAAQSLVLFLALYLSHVAEKLPKRVVGNSRVIRDS